MPPTIQDTLLDLFDRVRQDPDTLPSVPIEDWQEGSVKSLGGELQIESAPGRGTRIRAQVPVHTAANNTDSLTA